jgi:NACalpha-BTF3-like transcription factor
MGKKGAKSKNKSGSQNQTSSNQTTSQKTSVGQYDHLPFVSICTPTFNRRPFWPMAIKCFQEYTYPKERMEWIIVDDGSDPIEDLVKDIPQVKYYYEKKQMILGRKRNYMHEQAKGDIIVYQDDDDYYPPDRVSHAVEKLMADPKVLAGGSSILFLYFKHIQQMYRFGPYGPNHSTAGTFAFKRELLEKTKYDDFKALAEERDFLKNYTIPFVQFNPLKTILVFSHNHNTFDKKELLKNGDGPTQRPDMNITVEDFVKNSEIYDFFMKNIDGLLAEYEPGNVENKPEVLQQMKTMTKVRQEEQARLEKMHYDVMQSDMVKTKLAEIEQLREQYETKSNDICLVNKKLVAKMKEMNSRIKELNLDDDTLNLIKQAEHIQAPPKVEFLEPKIIIQQKDHQLNYNSELIGAMLSFINRNMQFSCKIIANKRFEMDIDIKPEDIQLEYTTHRTNANEAANIQKASEAYLQMVNSTQHTSQAISSNNISNNVPSPDIELSPDDINTVMQQAECNEPTAMNALFNENNDVISAIMNVDNYKCDSFTKPNVNQQPDSNIDLSPEDINTVMEQAECNEATAMNALFNENNDVISAIMNVDNYKCDSFAKPKTNSKLSSNIELSPDDINTVMEQAECNEATAMNALFNENNDVISAIMNVDNYKCDSFNPPSDSHSQENTNEKITMNSKKVESLESTHPDLITVKRDGDTIVEVGLDGEFVKMVLKKLDDIGISAREDQIIPILIHYDLNVEKSIQDILQRVKAEYPDEYEKVIESGNQQKSSENIVELDPEDIETVIEQTGCDAEIAKKALLSEDNDAISAVMNIDKYIEPVIETENNNIISTETVIADNILHTDETEQDKDKADGIYLDGRKYDKLNAAEQLIVDRIHLLSSMKNISIFHAKTAYYNENMDIHTALKTYSKYLHLTPIDRPDHPNNIAQILEKIDLPINVIKSELIEKEDMLFAYKELISDKFKDRIGEKNEVDDICNQEYVDIVRSVTLCDEETAINALTQTNGNVRECIIDDNISKYKVDKESSETIDLVIGEHAEQEQERA